MMEMQSREHGEVTILQPRGKLMASGGAVLYEAVSRVLEAGSRKILIDCVEISAIDSIGVGELVHALASTRRLGGAMKLLHLPLKVLDLLEITRVAELFEHFDDEQSAVDSFA